jgi:hypothetical protein
LQCPSIMRMMRDPSTLGIERNNDPTGEPSDVR